jgi:hypothetical protein
MATKTKSSKAKKASEIWFMITSDEDDLREVGKRKTPFEYGRLLIVKGSSTEKINSFVGYIMKIKYYS